MSQFCFNQDISIVFYNFFLSFAHAKLFTGIFVLCYLHMQSYGVHGDFCFMLFSHVADTISYPTNLLVKQAIAVSYP